MATDAGGETVKATKKKVSPARNAIGVVLLVVFTTVAVMEVLANRGYNNAVNALQARMPKDDTNPNDKLAELPSREEAEKLIGRAADGPPVIEGNQQKATYTWRGAVRKYVLTAYYQGIKSPTLVRTE